MINGIWPCDHRINRSNRESLFSQGFLTLLDEYGASGMAGDTATHEVITWSRCLFLIEDADAGFFRLGFDIEDLAEFLPDGSVLVGFDGTFGDIEDGFGDWHFNEYITAYQLRRCSEVGDRGKGVAAEEGIRSDKIYAAGDVDRGEGDAP